MNNKVMYTTDDVECICIPYTYIHAPNPKILGFRPNYESSI